MVQEETALSPCNETTKLSSLDVKVRMASLEDRCDFSHLYRSSYNKYDTSAEKTNFGWTSASIKLDEKLLQDFESFAINYGVSLDTVMHFALHKVLNIFGTCDETVVAVETIMEGGKNNVIPFVYNHNEHDGLNLHEIIQSMENNKYDTKEIFIQKKERPIHFDASFQCSGSEWMNCGHTLQFGFNFSKSTRSISILFNEDFFDYGTIKGMLNVFKVILQQVADEPTKPAAELEYLTQDQLHQLEKWNAETDGSYPIGKRLEHLFEAAVEMQPQKTAIIHGDKKLTYRELNTTSNQLAHYLRFSLEAQPEQLLGLFLDKSDVAIMTILAVWKSGAACLPIDPAYPDERVLFSLEDTKASCVLTTSKYVSRLKRLCHDDVEIVNLDRLLDELHNESAENLEANATSMQLAYVSYTSGTTGVPKGVLKYHKSLVNCITYLADQYEVVNNNENIVLYSTYVFEPFFRQMLMAILFSNTLVIVDDDVKMNIDRFSQFLEKYQITYLNGTASILQEYDYSKCPHLKRLILVGEEITKVRYESLRKKFDRRIINEYGFTESAFVSLIKVFEPNSKRTDKSIGKPTRNVKCFVLSSNMKRVPVGAIGELHVGGAGISSGYHNRQQLTNAKFVPSLYRTKKEKEENIYEKMYKTGDLVRWNSNGELEYLGRNDFQIKLRGIRIEPGEIETILSKFDGVQKCVVAVRTSGEKNDNRMNSRYLVAYFVAPKQIRETTLISYLARKLPRYMIPNRIIQVNHIPNNVNGKVNLRALPIIDARLTDIEHLEARTDLDRQLCHIWSDVLDVPFEKISINDDFFMLGGNSISCIWLISHIRQRLQYNCTVEEVFSRATIKNLSDFLETRTRCQEYQEEQDNQDPEPSQDDALFDLPRSEDVECYFIANSLQEGLLYHHLKLNDKDDAYTMQALFDYNCAIDSNIYKASWLCAQKKYCSLRMRFHSANNVVQIIDKTQNMDWRYYDFTGKTESEIKMEIEKLLQIDRLERYNLSIGQLFRVYQIKKNETSSSLLFSCHHIILDGWSLPVLYDYIHETYLTLMKEKDVAFSTDTSYIDAQRYLQKHQKDNLEFWNNEISVVTDRCDLQCLLKDEHRGTVQLSKYDLVLSPMKETISISSVERLKQFCSKYYFTLHSVLQFAWHKVLAAYGNSQYTVIGTTVSGRNLPVDNIEDSVGLYINTLPLIVDHAEQKKYSIIEAIGDIQKKVNQMNSHANVHLGNIHTGESKHGLFDTLFVLESTPKINKAKESAYKKLLGFKKVYNFDKIDYPLAVVSQVNNEGELSFSIMYAGELFESHTIRKLLELVQFIIQQITNGENQNVEDLNFVLPSDEQLLCQFNKTEFIFPLHQTLHGIFEKEVELAGENLAVVYEDTKLSYKDLNKKANQMSHYLTSLQHLKPDDIVGVVMDKSELLIVTILAVWKAGAAYVPIDTGYPNDRIAYILTDTNAKIVVSNSQYVSKLEKLISPSVNVVGVETFFNDDLSHLSCINPVPNVKSTDLAYVIYTSGTTGKPKGVMVEHQGVVNLKFSMEKLFQLKKEKEVLLSFSNYVFDHFVEQMTDAILNGQTLLILNDSMREDTDSFYSYMKTNNVTYLSGTPSVICEYDFTGLDHLKRVDVVGEDLTYAMFNKIRKTFPGLIINGYGPTEISITSHKRLYPCHETRTNKSIGFQVKNSRCYVLNRDMKRVPVRAIGEMYIGGVGVTRGYLNREDLTEKKFVRNPFQTEEEKQRGENSRMYATGDLVRWMGNGEIEYFGRNDNQVKIRGLRIELGEIESVLATYPGIVQSAVITKKYEKTLAVGSITQTYILGYYASEGVLPPGDVRKYMQTKLPMYMVPNKLVQLKRLPLSKSGKLNYKELPEIDLADIKTDVESPTNEIEGVIRNIWAELLGLPAENVGIKENFFNLGGDSMKIIQQVFHIKQKLGCTVTVPDLLQNQTIKDIALCIISGGHKVFELKDIVEDHVVSFAQERLLFIDELEGGTNAYNVPMIYELSSDVNKQCLKKALFSVIEKHDILRTVYPGTSKNSLPVQHVLTKEEAEKMFDIQEILIGGQKDLDNYLLSQSSYKFKLDTEMPIRASIYTDGQNGGCYMMVNIHHIAFDAWSQEIFERNLKEFYQCHLQNRPISSSSLTANYQDFALWQRKHLNEHRIKELEKYWTKSLDGMEMLNLKTDYPRPSQFDYTGQEMKFGVDADITSKLVSLAREMKVSLNSLLTSAFAFVLSKFSYQNDLLIGLPVGNRDNPDYLDMIGFFVNMLALRITVKENDSLENFIQSVNNAVTQALIFQEMPFEKLLKVLKIERDPSRHPLVQVIFSSEVVNPKRDLTSSICNSSLQMKRYSSDITNYFAAKFDMSTHVVYQNGTLEGSINYATKLFHHNTVASISKCFQDILYQFTKFHTKVLVQDLHSFVELDNVRDIESCNVQDSVRKLLHHEFEHIAKTIPDAISLVCEDVKLTYKELNERANQLANYLKHHARLNPDDIIALFLDKSELMIISILAVWKTGAAYVPIDPSFPTERVHYIMKDTNSKIILSNSKYKNNLENILPAETKNIIVDDQATKDEIYKQPKTNLESNAIEKNLAYVIYTSGTTGKPKGVMVEHKSVLSFHADIKSKYFGENTESILFLSNYVFDFSIEQMLLSIFNSNKMIIAKGELSLDRTFYDYVNENELTFLSGTPTFLMQIDVSRISTLKVLLVAGEAFTQGQYDKFRSRFNGNIVQAYGTTETTVYNLVKTFRQNAIFENSLGTPLRNTKVFVLDKQMKVLPQGAIGELCLSGTCLARGYLNQESLTEKSFVQNGTEKMYRTGDLVRIAGNGELEYLGRNDTQVSIHGLRVEVSEIEAVISRYPHITQSAVVAQSDKVNANNTRYLVCYLVTEDPDFTDVQLRLYLEKYLPLYMIPTRVVQVTGNLPVTINGKLDMKKLQHYDVKKDESVSRPSNADEEKLCQLWCHVLGINEIGVDDDFFLVGGDSILSMQIVSQMRNECGIRVTIKDIFVYRTIRRILQNATKEEIEQHFNEQEDLPTTDVTLLPIQEWFFEKDLSNPNCWNQNFTVKTPNLNVVTLKQCLTKLIEHHDAFRLRFEQNGVSHVQRYDSKLEELNLTVFDIHETTDHEIEVQLEKLQNGFQIDHGPLFSVVYVYGYSDNTARVHFSIHHLIVDTVSWRILIRDLHSLYNGKALSKGTSYARWVKVVKEYQQPLVDEMFWEECKKNVTKWKAGLNFEKDKSVNYQFDLDSKQSEGLLRRCNLAYNTTLDDLFLTSVAYAMKELTGFNRNFVTLEGHGRESLSSSYDVSNTVGWFTTMYPVELEVSGGLEDSIIITKDNRGRIPMNGFGFGLKYGYKEELLPQVTFNYLGQFDNHLRQPDDWCLANERNVMMVTSSKQTTADMTSVVDVTVMFTEGKMKFDISSRLDNEKVNKFVKTLSCYMEKIIDHTLVKADNEKNSKDFASPEKSQISIATFDPYIEFKCSSSAKTLFILPPGEGGAESYLNNLALHLQQKYNLILFNNLYLHEENTLKTFEDLARFYILQIKQIQPRGPYNFLGWSFGGVLAMEISMQLKATNDDVTNLVFIDSYFNVSKSYQDINRVDKTDILDMINYVYKPSEEHLKRLSCSGTNIVLFKAARETDAWKTEDERLLFSYYTKDTKYNNLDTFISSQRIELHEFGETHFSWVKNQKVVKELCEIIISIIQTS